MGCPARTHASIPPRSGRIFLNPACLRCFAAVAADSSFGPISRARERGACPCGGGGRAARRGSFALLQAGRANERYMLQMSGRKYLTGVAFAVSMITASSAAQRAILKPMPACPNIKDFTDWFEAMEKGNASRARLQQRARLMTKPRRDETGMA
jgi:hypothetical protein